MYKNTSIAEQKITKVLFKTYLLKYASLLLGLVPKKDGDMRRIHHLSQRDILLIPGHICSLLKH